MFALYYTTTFVYFKLTISCCEQNTLDCILTFRPNETISVLIITPHAQRERGKVIGRGVHIYIYVCGRKKI